MFTLLTRRLRRLVGQPASQPADPNARPGTTPAQPDLTAPADQVDLTEPADRADVAEPADQVDLAERVDLAEPTDVAEPTDRADLAEHDATERVEPGAPAAGRLAHRSRWVRWARWVPRPHPTRWSRRKKIAMGIAAGTVLALVGGTTGGVAMYAGEIQLPGDPVVPQASVLYFRDGRTVLARLGVANRTDVPLAQVPRPVRLAVLAAEDRSFYHHLGLSARGVARAAWVDLFGGSQGASTITQQYIRNAYLTQERTAGRKAREMVLAVKLEQRYTKNEILERYLNTIYFGRGAYGIAAAARAYFGTTPDQLTVAQGAVLASVIKDPWGFDPAVDEPAARGRWQWTVQAMVDQGWLSAGAAKRLAYPQVLAPTEAGQGLSGPNGLVVDAVERELEGRGIPPQVLRTAGLRVVTTVDEHAQQAATERMSTLASVSPDLHGALVAVDPATGGVVAWYGGRQGQGFYDDAAAPRPPASTFKPLVLAVGLGQGVSYQSRWDGSTPRLFPGRLGVPLRNQQNQQCPNCTLDEAMVRSLNTPFYALAEQVGASKIRDLALAMGVSAQYGTNPSLVDLKGDPKPGRTRPDIAIGRYPVSPADLASVYATFASGGVRTTRHLVQTVTGAGGDQWYQAPTTGTRVLDPAVAADVTTVLHHVAEHDGEPAGHPAAAKTGTQQWGNTSDNQDAWMAGYTPDLATVVWVGRATPGPIRDAHGTPIAGDGLPAQLWREFLTDALNGSPAQVLPGPAHLGRTDAGDAGKSKSDVRAGAGAKAGGMTLVDHTRGSGKRLALTLDDGPGEDTAAILDLLAQYRVPAVFCMVGEQVNAYPKTVRRIVSDGHQLCNHSMHHDDLSTMSADQVRADLTGMLDAVAAAAPGSTVQYLRAPGGAWGQSPAVGVSLGMTPVTWTVDPEDWDTPGVDAIVRAVREQLKPGGIVLVHDGGGDRSQTIAALKILIPELLAEGWVFDLPATTTTASPLTGAPSSPSPATGGTSQPSGGPSASQPAAGGSGSASPGSGVPSSQSPRR